MDLYNMTAYLITMGAGAVCMSVLFYFSAVKSRNIRTGKALPLSACVLPVGIILGIFGAKLFYFVFRFSYILDTGFWSYWFALKTEEMSYYGAVAGVTLAVFLGAKLCGVRPRDAFNAFAPAGALMAAVARFAECFLFPTGLGAYLDGFLPWPLAVEFWPDYILAVYNFEGFFSLTAFVLALFHRNEPRRFLRTLFYLCLPQIFLESLRSDAINLLFMHLEQLLCYLFVEGVLIWYAFACGSRRFSSWIPALAGLAVSAVFIVGEFMLEGKIQVNNTPVPRWITWSVMIAALAAAAFMEHRANRRLSSLRPEVR